MSPLPTPRPPRAPRVLVVDDDDACRETMRTVLEDAGYVVTEALAGASALDCLRTSQERLVALVDWLMPGVDGHQVLQAVDTDPTLATRHAYILVTANPTPPAPELRDLLTRLHVPILLKPFDIDRLLELVAATAERLV